jgi:hypothetical protein
MSNKDTIVFQQQQQQQQPTYIDLKIYYVLYSIYWNEAPE